MCRWHFYSCHKDMWRANNALYAWYHSFASTRCCWHECAAANITGRVMLPHLLLLQHYAPRPDSLDYVQPTFK
jgi:hypothetical protein